MSCYFIANIQIRDEEEYRLYLTEAGKIFERYNGQYLAIDDQPEVLEGSWNYTRTVLIRFGSKDDFDQWYESEAYRKILKHRLKGAVCDSILVKGNDVK